MENWPAVKNTGLLQAWSCGDRAALNELTPRVCEQLRRLAGNYIQNERPAAHPRGYCLGSHPEVRTGRGTDLPALEDVSLEQLCATRELRARGEARPEPQDR